MPDLSKVGLPTFISDYTWDGTSSGAVTAIANVTSGALLVKTDSSSTITATSQPADGTVANTAVLTSGSATSTPVCSLSIPSGVNTSIFAVSASASAGPCKVELFSVNASGALATKFFSSANPSVDFMWPTGLSINGGLSGETVQVQITNFCGLEQTAYASIFYHQN